MSKDRTSWQTAVGDVGNGVISVRGYALDELIRHVPFSSVVYLTIRGELPSAAQTRVMDSVLCAIVEHGFYSPTTVAARMIASARPEGIIEGVAASLLTVGSVTVSPQHSAALMQEAIEMVETESVTLAAAASIVVERLVKERKRMPGAGHPLHPNGDPRAVALREVAQANGVWGAHAQVFELMVGEYCERVGRILPINVDGMLACVLAELGFAPVEMPGVAAISFMPGLIAHAVEEITGSRKLRVVDGAYVGPGPRALPPDLGYGVGQRSG